MPSGYFEAALSTQIYAQNHRILGASQYVR